MLLLKEGWEEGASWEAGIILYHDLGGGYTGVSVYIYIYVYINSHSVHLRLCILLYFN